MPGSSSVFLPSRGLGYVSNHVPLQVRYIKSRKENLIVTCVGKSFHTYGISHFGLLSVSPLHPDDINCMTSDAYHIYTAVGKVIYAWRRGTELKHTYKGHQHNVRLMIPFGAHLVSVDESNNVKIWDIKAETVYTELLFNSENFNVSAILHPSTYINKILLASDTGGMQLWNINNAKLIYTFKKFNAGVSCLEQAPAIDVAAIGLSTGRIILHNLKYDETIMEFTQDWGLVTSISFRTDGNPIMATGSACGHIVFWDLEERRVSSQLQYAHDGPVTGMVCLPNEPLVITSSPDNTLKLWIFDMTDGGARLLRIREGHSATPSYVRFHGSNGHNILSSAGDSTLRIFNTQTEQFNKSLGKASYNRKISKKRGRAVEDPLKMPPIVQFTSEVTREKEWDNIAAVHSDIALVTTWSYDKIKMGDLKLLPERFHKKNKDVNLDVVATCLSLTHCGNFVLVGYSTGHVDRFNMQSGHWRDTYGNPSAHKNQIRGTSSDTLNQVAITGGGSKIKFWRFKCKGTSPIAVIPLEESISFFRSHRESSMLAIALDDFSVDIMDIDMKRIVRKFSGHTAQLTDATFSPDSRWLVTSSMDCSIRTWDIPSGQLIDEFATDAACVSLDFSPTGESLATAHVDYLGIFLWSNKTLYVKITLKPLTPSENPPLMVLPECRQETVEEEEDEEIKTEDEEFISPAQISRDLITLSGLATSRWQNLLDLDAIKRRNKPKEPPRAPKAAPFFLPTVSSLNNIQFDIQPESEDQSKLIAPVTFVNLTEFGKLLQRRNYEVAMEKLKTLGPSMIDFEIKSLSPDNGGSVEVMLEFMKCLEFVLKSNGDFELAEAYLSVFLKCHGIVLAQNESLRQYLPHVMSCHNVAWERLQEKILYCTCVVQNLKTM
ncbi:unnamed protein product [Phyllotreta striolata]|uniref:Small-subunit processome Utp21 domain-containing protein n=1 Tax=Phyllotreta striolata TaxID=444603 RepID=A0A9N9TMZ1_PHYSR|nr:unnamed protein product [Phyllotreta striolata]